MRDEEAPWHDWFGHALAAADLGKLLKPYGVKSKDVKIAGVNLKGYQRADLAELWARYLPPPGLGEVVATGATSATSQVSGTFAEATGGLPESYPDEVAPGSLAVAVAIHPLSRQVAPVAQVAPTLPGSGNVACTRHTAWDLARTARLVSRWPRLSW